MKLRALASRGALPATKRGANPPFASRRAIDVARGAATQSMTTTTTRRSTTTAVRSSQRASSFQSTAKPPPLARAVAASATPDTSQSEDDGGLSILWLKHDLRLDDHSGFDEALGKASTSTSSHLLPLYVLDGAAIRETCPGPCGARALVGALESLRESLRARGSDLVVVACDPSSSSSSSADAVVALAARELGAARVIAESEFSPEWRARLRRVEERLAAEDDGEKGDGEKAPRPVLVEWSASLHAGGGGGGGDYDFSYGGDWRQHSRSRGPRLSPLNAPGALPPLPGGYERALFEKGLLRLKPGSSAIPTVDEVLSLVEAAAASSSSRYPSSSSDDSEKSPSSSFSSSPFSSSPFSSAPVESVGSVLPYGAPDSARDVAASLVYSGGEATARAALAAYVSSGGSSEGKSELDEAIATAAGAVDVPGSEGASFAALFAPSLALGTVSARRVAAEAAAALAGLPPLSSLFAPAASAARARAALASAEAADFHRAVALSRAGAAARGGGQPRHWRWRGVLTEYVVVRPGDVNSSSSSSSSSSNDSSSSNSTSSPPSSSRGNVLLVHGFGAFGEHYRDAASALAREGFTVFAPTLPGYGRSEKPPARYGQGLWGSFVEEFAREVVRGPVVAAGNSIGGYIVSAAAASSGRDVFKGVVLLNPAGRVDGIATGQETGGGAPVQVDNSEEAGDESLESSSSKPPSRLFVEVVSRALFLYLELSISRTLKKLYPSNPDAADAWLASEIGRAARDPGALAVFQSVFYMPRPRALDVLLVNEYKGPTLLLQGAKDPLNDARARAEALRGAVPGIEVVLLDAGHCPHDEVPAEVAERIAVFAERCFESSGGGGGGGGRGSSESSESESEAAVVAV